MRFSVTQLLVAVAMCGLILMLPGTYGFSSLFHLGGRNWTTTPNVEYSPDGSMVAVEFFEGVTVNRDLLRSAQANCQGDQRKPGNNKEIVEPRVKLLAR